MFFIGDYTNADSDTITIQLAILCSAPQSILVIQCNGYVQMQYGYSQSSDELFITNIKTIKSVLDKTLLFRSAE